MAHNLRIHTLYIPTYVHIYICIVNTVTVNVGIPLLSLIGNFLSLDIVLFTNMNDDLIMQTDWAKKIECCRIL